jgi:hypothetical protein
MNINGIVSTTRLKMLDEFLHKQDIDIALLQEVTQPSLHTIPRYTAHINQGTEGRGKAILTKDGLDVSNIKRLPSGRGMAAVFNGTWIVTVYAPSGAEKKLKAKASTTQTYYVNYRIQKLTCFSLVISTVYFTPLTVQDKQITVEPLHTLYEFLTSTMCGTRLTYDMATPIMQHVRRRGWIGYVTEHLLERKQGVETVPSAFADHFAVVLRLVTDTPLPVRGKGYRKMNTSYLHETTFRDVIKEHWTRWHQHKKFYPNNVM